MCETAKEIMSRYFGHLPSTCPHCEQDYLLFRKTFPLPKGQMLLDGNSKFGSPRIIKEHVVVAFGCGCDYEAIWNEIETASEV